MCIVSIVLLTFKSTDAFEKNRQKINNTIVCVLWSKLTHFWLIARVTYFIKFLVKGLRFIIVLVNYKIMLNSHFNILIE